MKEFEDVVLVRMYDKELFSMNYKSIEKVASMVKWQDIQHKYQVKKSFKKSYRQFNFKNVY